MESNKTIYDIIVIGAGSGGLVVASGAAGIGAKVLLVEKRLMGGDCLNYGCVPSKTFLKSAHFVHNMRESEKFGIAGVTFEVDLKKIMDRVHAVIEEIAPHDSKERYESLGVDVVFGAGCLLSRNEVQVNNVIYTGKKIVISTGSKAMIPPIDGLDTVAYETNETIFSMTTLPKRLVVIGGGPIGCELGQGFAHLGSKVSIIDRNKTLFSKDEPEVWPIMEKQFQKDELDLYLESQVKQVEKNGDEILVTVLQGDNMHQITCDRLLVSSGRTPNTSDMGLKTVGIQLNKRGYIEVDDHLETSIPGIYACGDVTGGFQFTHSAGYEAGIVIRNALIGKIAKVNYKNISWATYTVPEIAHVGFSERGAKEAGVYAATYWKRISENDRAKAEEDREGFVKIIVDQKKRVIGATVVSEKGGELIASLALMVSQKMELASASSVIYPYPTQSEIIKAAALDEMKANAKEWQMKLLNKIVKR